MSEISLEFQEMQDAAQAVAAGVEPLNTVLTDLGGAIEAAATGFKGQAAAGLGEALGSWFEVAGTLGPILEGYAQSIMTVANEHLLNENVQSQTYSDLVQRLGGSHE
jgi:uncharacterized protein YukE